MKKFTTATTDIKKRRILRVVPVLAVAGILSVVLTGCGSSDEEVQRYSWPLATASPEDTVTQIFAEKFTDDDGPSQFDDLGCQIQIPFQVGSVQDVYDDVRFFINNNISCNDFIQRTGCQAVCTGKIDEQKTVIVIIAAAFLLFYRNAGIIADVLFRTRNIIKNCRLSAVRIAGEGNLDRSCIIHDY